VAEYLLAEVLDRQPEKVRRLLTRTSILERVNGELADLLTGEAGGGAERLLQDLETVNAFVLSLDASRTWFRYHHLFSGLLRLELRRTEPGAVAGLHELASRWLAKHGFPVEATRHAQAAQDWKLAAAVIADHWSGLHLSGQNATVHALLAGFPARLRAADAELAAIAAIDELGHGSMEAAKRSLAVAEGRAATVSPGRRRHAEVLAGMARLLLAGRSGDQQARAEEARRLAASSPWCHAESVRRGGLMLSLVLVAASATGTGSAAYAAGSPCAGTAISAPQSWLAGAADIATEMLPDGNTLVVVSAGFPTASYAVADEFTSACTPDRAFGDDGTEHLTFGGQAFTISAAIPAADGKTILAGSTAKGWLIARVDASGRLDPGFGTGGSTVLPWPGSVSAITLTSSGGIILGSTAGGGCCVREWVGELRPDGALMHSFGDGGRTAIPVYLDDSGISRVWAAPDGEILALSGGGNMGCWDTYVSALSSQGRLVPGFQSNFNSAIRRAVPSQIFVADAVARPGGFLLVGTDQDSCVSSVPSRTAQGRILTFQLNGKLAGSTAFTSPMTQPAWALPRSNGGFVLVTSAPVLQLGPHARASLTVLTFSASGRSQGRAVIQLPYGSQSYPAGAVPVTIATNGRVSSLVTSNATGKALLLTQLPY
jgi:hypothetical protein